MNTFLHLEEKQWKCVCNKEAEEFSLCDDCEVKNKLTAFLEEKESFDCGNCGHNCYMRNHNYEIINTLLDIVGEEIGKLYEPYEGEEQIMIEHHTLDRVSQILTNLKK